MSFRSQGDPILYINNPPGVTDRRCAAAQLDGISALNEMTYQARRRPGDAHAHRSSTKWPFACRPACRTSPTSAKSRRPPSTLYGEDARKPGTFANTALHGPPPRRTRRALRADLSQQLGPPRQRRRPHARPVPRRRPAVPTALIQDLKQRGLFDDTLIIWGGEFGRTIYSQGGLTKDELRPRSSPALLHHVDGRRRRERRHDLRRDRRLLLQHRQGPGPRPRLPRHGAAPARHRPRALLGFRAQGLDFHLTGVEKAHVVKAVVA